MSKEILSVGDVKNFCLACLTQRTDNKLNLSKDDIGIIKNAIKGAYTAGIHDALHNQYDDRFLIGEYKKEFKKLKS